MHLPRSAFSERQLGLLVWLLRSNGVGGVPSAKVMKATNDILQKSCGIESIRYKGPLGHTYYANNLRQIIAQVCNCQIIARNFTEISTRKLLILESALI